MHRLLARAALAIDGGRGNRLGPTSGEHRVAADVEGLLPNLHDATHDHVVDQCGIEIVALLQRLQDVRGKSGWVPILQFAVALAAGGANGVDDYCFCHVISRGVLVSGYRNGWWD